MQSSRPTLRGAHRGARRALGRLALCLLALVFSWPAAGCRSKSARRAPPVGTAPEVPGFRRASPQRALHFPADHGAHPDYQTEWWYYTGNLSDAKGRAFGYQLTFFRRALLPPQERRERKSDWAAEQIYMAHFTVTDVSAGRQHAFEQFGRGAAGLAGVETVPFRVWSDDWSVRAATDALQLHARRDGIELTLRLEPLQGPVLHGRAGYSQKGPDPGNASHYYSMPRLASDGVLRIGEESFAVRGESWMDHEFGTSALGADQVGWDWFSLQLDDGSEIMLFQLRDASGAIDAFSSGTFIAVDGAARPFARDEFSLRVTDTWTSDASGARYPAGWQLAIPGEQIDLRIEPRVADQELVLSYVYWEGCVAAGGTHAGAAVRALGYAELTGYAVSMQSRL